MTTTDLGISGRVLVDAAAHPSDPHRALVGYYPVGFPSVEHSLGALRTIAAGCDLVEIGMPYSDPVMDGPTIQTATTRALAGGVRTKDIFTAAETVARTGTTPVVMTYWNLVEQYGPDAFARDLAAAGGAGLVTPDLIPDEAEEWFAASDAHGLDRIFLVAPSSTDERIVATTRACRGWVYATSVMGVTGARAATSAAAPELVARVRALAPDLPIGIGLGVSSGEQARETAAFADAVIVGSALVRTMLDAQDAGNPRDTAALAELVAELAQGVRR